MATDFGKILDCAHVDRGRVYGGYSVGNEVREGEDYRRVDVGDQVIAVGQLAEGVCYVYRCLLDIRTSDVDCGYENVRLVGC